ncbi:hypothetical protein SAMN05216370_0138 [Pseudomonas peli]|uniref:Uncharacterized protein n=1 Tax=Pseudomonas peli TaxID=592361 RepID=A0AB37ZEH2_9PSED|nr:hypothetical protein SAMN05216370_0138 [Pseudomonas peli]
MSGEQLPAWIWYGVRVTKGPPKRPHYKATVFVRATDKAGALKEAKRRLTKAPPRSFFEAWKATPAQVADWLRIGPAKPPGPNTEQINPERPNPRLADSWGFVLLACKCGHSDDLEAFCRLSSGVQLPRNEYQCPKCFRAWRIEAEGEGWTAPGGLYIPPKRVSVAIPPRI